MITKPDEKIYGDSETYKNWMSRLTPTTCEKCVKLHGSIYLLYEPPYFAMEHENCKCVLVQMRTKKLGYVTEDKWNGADVYIACLGKLPDNYVTQKEAEVLGWKQKKGNLHEVLPNATIGGDVFQNKENKLPSADGRIWYEADIDYEGGFRNNSRILYSNDGLIFATYDHYHTFYEVLQ